MPLTVTKDNTAKILQSVIDLTRQQLLIGIPESDAARKSADAGGSITNAQLGYIHEYGVPEKNIPARPFLVPGVKSILNKAASQFKSAAIKTLDSANSGTKPSSGGAASSGSSSSEAAVKNAMNSVGLLAVNAVRKKITEGPFAPLAESTIAARARRGRKGAKEYMKQAAAGQVPEAGLVKPLMDTGQLRNSITYVVRKRSGVK